MVGGGLGSFIGPIHRMAAKMDNSAELVAGNFSRSAKVNKATGMELGLDPARVYADWQSMIDAEKDKVDFVTVCTPNDSHYAIARAALEAGLHVMCEKPLSLTLKEAEALEKLAAKKKLVLAIPFTYTGNAAVKLARDLVKSGKLGKLGYHQRCKRRADTGWKKHYRQSHAVHRAVGGKRRAVIRAVLAQSDRNEDVLNGDESRAQIG